MRHSFSTCRAGVALVSQGGTTALGRLVAPIAQLGMLAVLGGACTHESTPREADTLATVSASPARDSATPLIAVMDSAPVALAGQITDSVPAPLSCIPDRFGPGDTLTLGMRVPHGDYLTVTPPKGPIYFIVYPRWDKPRRRYSLVPSEDFRRISNLKLPSDVRAIVRVIDRDTIPEPVFTTPGKYLLRMGENLESDYGNLSHTCLLNFTQSSK
jgi:hypothetical protein